MRPFADDAHVLVVSECDADAVQLAGGPATGVAVTVTFCDGWKPAAVICAVVPYAPELSAA